MDFRVRSRAERPHTAEITQRSEELLELVQLGGLGERYPHQLSGGQRQRVALARAMAINPSVLLLDEPFGALDAKVRKELRQWLREFHRRTGVTTIFVSHDQEEALELADRVVILREGKIAQIGSVDEVYEHPASPDVFQFLGDSNRIPATLVGSRLWAGDTVIADYGRLSDDLQGKVDIYVRPSDLRVAEMQPAALEVIVRAVQRTGPVVRAQVELLHSAQWITVELPHLHFDVKHFREGAVLRLRLMAFNVYASAETVQSPVHMSPLAPILTGRDRVRLSPR